MLSSDGNVQGLANWIDEADLRLIVHVKWAVIVQKCEKVIVMSIDNDTFGELLRHTLELLSCRLKELWKQYRTGLSRHSCHFTEPGL